MLFDRSALCLALGEWPYWADEDERCCTQLLIMLERQCVDVKIGLQRSILRLGVIDLLTEGML